MAFFLRASLIALFLTAPVMAGEDGLTGYWKVHIYQGGQQSSPWWLMHLESKDGKLSASIVPLRESPKAKAEEPTLTGDLFAMKIRANFGSAAKPKLILFDLEGKLPKPGAKKIFGSLVGGGAALPIVLESTTAKNPFELDREVILRTPNDPKVLFVILDLIEDAKENKVAAKDLQEWVNVSLKTADSCGPRMLLKHQLRLLDVLKNQKTYAAVAVEIARKIGKQIDPKMPADAQMELLASVAAILREGGEKTEAQAIEARLDKLEEQSYLEHEKTKSSFKIEKYAGRKVKSDRAVLLELFTGAQCPPCVAADMAFDGVAKTYAPGEVVLLQYHLDIPRPEPMSNPAAMERFKYYEDKYEKVGGTPTSLFNGKPEALGGGFKDDAAEKYKEYQAVLGKLLESPASLKLSATAAMQGDKIDMAAKVSGLEKPNEKIRLRFVLVEDWVRYKGSNGLQYHHRVVRAMPGGAKGFGLKEKDSEHKASVDLEELRKSLNKYLDEDYPEGPRPMRLRHLSVVAFVQNDVSLEVLQAVNVPAKKE